MKFHIEHTFRGISLADYEKLSFSETFNQALCKSVQLGREVRSLEDKNGHFSRVLQVAPKDREIPGPVAKILGASRIEYTEYMDYDWGSYKAHWRTVSSVMTDKVSTSGSMGFDQRPGGVLRWVDGEIKVKLLAVGGVIERFIVSDIERSYEKAAAFTQSWIDKGGEV